MNIYPELRPIVIFNSPTMQAGVWFVRNKSSEHYLLGFNDFDKHVQLHHNYTSKDEAIAALKSISSQIAGFTYFTVYNSDDLSTEVLLSLLEKSSKDT